MRYLTETTYWKAALMFTHCVALALFLMGGLQLYGAVHTPALNETGPLLIHFLCYELFAVGILHLGLSAALLKAVSGRKQLTLLAGIGFYFLGYRIVLRAFHLPDISNLLPSFSEFWSLSVNTLETAVWIFSVFLWTGCLCFFLLRPRIKNDVSQRPTDNGKDILESTASCGTNYSSKHIVLNWCVGVLVLAALAISLRSHTGRRTQLNLEQIADEIYSIPGFRSAPAVNYEGNALLYAKNSEEGISINLVDLLTLQQKTVATIGSVDRARPKAFNLLGWSPADRYFGYSVPIETSPPGRRVNLCSQAGDHVGSVAAFDIDGSIEDALWLTTNSLVVVNSSYGLLMYNVEADTGMGQFGKKGLVNLCRLQVADGVYGLTKLSGQSVVYIANGNCWEFDILSNKTSQLSHFSHDRLDWLDYDGGNRKLLVCSTDLDQPGERFLYEITIGDATTNAVHRLTQTYTFKGQWLREPKGFAYIGTQGNSNFLSVATEDMALRTNLFSGGHILSYCAAPGGGKVYTVASKGNEPLSIWEYDVLHRTMRNIVPSSPLALTHAQVIPPVQSSFIDSTGAKGSFYYLPPAHLEPGRKYPAVIDRPNDSRFDHGSQLLANCGVFYAAANRYGLASSDLLETAADDMLAIRQELMKNPNIDPDRIYISGRSVSTEMVSEIIDRNPALWRGVILLSPVRYPRSNSHAGKFPSVFISLGDKEIAAAREEAAFFAKIACRSLVSTKILFHRSAGHWFEGIKSSEERYEGVAQFILTDL